MDRMQTSFEERPLCLVDMLNDQEKTLVSERCTTRCVAPGTTLFLQATARTETFLIRKGLVRTYYISPHGKEVTVGYWSAGDIVGGPDFYGKCKHIWSCEAIEVTEVWAIKGHDLQELARAVPAVAECIVIALSFKLRWVSLLLQNMGTESVSHRLAFLMLSLGKMYGVTCSEGVKIRYLFTQEELANMICATRQWVSVTFKRFQRDGIIKISSRYIILSDIVALHAITE